MMPKAFSPTFTKFQADIEAYLIAEGKRERTKDGFTIFRGYPAALELMFGRYLEAEALEPLVSHFRVWNWEHSYNDFLTRLTDALLAKRDWELLERLWSGVIAKRRKLYNDIRKLERKAPGTVPSSSVASARENLLETLQRVRSYSASVGDEADATPYGE